MPLAGARRAARQHALRDHPGPRPRRRRALRHVRGRPRPLQGKGRLPLVAEARQLGLIIRKAYDTRTNPALPKWSIMDATRPALLARPPEPSFAELFTPKLVTVLREGYGFK